MEAIKNIIITLLAALFTTITANAAGSFPQGTCGLLINYPSYYPITDLLYIFSTPVSVKDGAEAYVYHKDEIVATGLLRMEKSSLLGSSLLYFDSDVYMLPKGRTYRMEIPAGSLYLESDPSVCNDLMIIDFCVPSYIAGIYLHKKVGESVASGMMFYFDLGISAPNSPLMEVYRDGVLVGTAPVSATGGSDSFVSASPFNVVFEDEVPYTLALPESSIWVRDGADMANPEMSVNLIGSIIESYPTADYVDMEKIFDPETNVLSKVIFYYDQPIMMVENESVQLLDGNDLVAEADNGYTSSNEAYSYYGEDDGTWMLIADFSRIADRLEPGKDYDAVPTDGAVYAVTDIHGGSSVQSASTENNVLLGCTDGTLTVKNAAQGSLITAYTVDGRMAGSTVADGTAPATLALPVKGLYIVTVGHRSYKVMNR